MRNGSIDCVICMFGAPFPDCCLKDCGTKEKCQGCDWYTKYIFKVTVKEEKENQENGKEEKMD